MDILIACHSNNLPLRTERKIGVTEDDRFRNIKYIDIHYDDESSSNQYVRWEDIPSESMDVLWPVSAPVYVFPSKWFRMLSEFEQGSDVCLESLERDISFQKDEFKIIWDNLLTEGLRILRPGGKLYIPQIVFETWDLLVVRHMVVNHLRSAGGWSIPELKTPEFVLYSAKNKSTKDETLVICIEKII